MDIPISVQRILSDAMRPVWTHWRPPTPACLSGFTTLTAEEQICPPASYPLVQIDAPFQEWARRASSNSRSSSGLHDRQTRTHDYR